MQVDFSGSKTISEVNVFSLQDNYSSPIEPTEATTFSLYGLTGFQVQYWNGSAWTTVPGGTVTGNNKVWKKISFAPITTSKIRVLISATSDGWSRMVEVEAWTTGSSNVKWLVADHLGTPRMIIDQTGTLANVKRHDYLPFGEELFAGAGGRSTGLGYSGGDGLRQQFTSKERDIEIGLDYFEARYYSSTQGRFTSVDPENAGADESDPQSWNGYAYARNNPVLYTDPDGQKFKICYKDGDCHEVSDEQWKQIRADAEKLGSVFKDNKIYNEVDGKLVETASYRRTSFDDLSDFANAVIFGNRQTAGLVDRAPAAGKAAVITYGVGAAIGVTAGVAAYVAPALATEAVVGLTSKAAARSAIERMAVSPAAKAAAKRAVSRATASSKIDVIRESGSLIVRIERAGRNGYQVIESVIKSDGTKTVVQKAFDAAGKSVHYHPK